MARKKNTAATVEQQTVEFSVARDGDDEFYRRRVWSQEGTRYLVIDSYSAAEVIQFHAFSQQPIRITNVLLRIRGGDECRVRLALQEVLPNFDKIIMATGDLSRRYSMK